MRLFVSKDRLQRTDPRQQVGNRHPRGCYCQQKTPACSGQKGTRVPTCLLSSSRSFQDQTAHEAEAENGNTCNTTRPQRKRIFRLSFDEQMYIFLLGVYLGVGWLAHRIYTSSALLDPNGTPLQYSCLENPRDGGAWWAAVYGVTRSGTRLK